MIYTNKTKISKALNKTRPTIDKMIDDGFIKELKNDNGKRVGYVNVLDFICYLTTK